MPQFISATDPDFASKFNALLTAKREDSPDVDDAVAAIIADVRARGDAAVLELTERFDRLKLTPEQLRISAEEIDAVYRKWDFYGSIASVHWSLWALYIFEKDDCTLDYTSFGFDRYNDFLFCAKNMAIEFDK